MSVAKKLVKKPIDEKILKKLIPLNALSLDRLRELAEKADIEQASASRVLFKRGEMTAKTYYLLSGEVEVQLPTGQHIQIKADTPAALHPLAQARPRQATVLIKTSSTLLRIDTGLLDIVLNDGRGRGYEVNEIHTEDESDWMTRFLQSLSVMSIPIKNIENLMASMEEQSVRAGETVIRQAEADPQHYFVIKQGRCVVTKQAASGKTPIRVAELSEGIGFGEEALLTRQPRNATVTMLTDGSIMRLKKPDFTRLIAEPAVQTVSYEQARDMVESGAVWIDARGESEHRQDGIVGSTHIPLTSLRLRARELNSYGQYIVYCDSGNRATAAAFLLRQAGLAAFALINGMSDVPESARHGNKVKTSDESAGLAAVVTLAPARNTGTESVKPTQPPVSAPLKPAATVAVTATENVRSNPKPLADSVETKRVLVQTQDALGKAQAELELLRAELSTAQNKEQDLTQRLTQKQNGIAAELQGIAQEQAQLKHRLTQTESARSQLAEQTEALRRELNEARAEASEETRRANAETARYRDEAAAQKARINDYALNLTSTEAAYETAQQELDGLRREQDRAAREQQAGNSKLKAEIAAKAADLETMKQQLEREVDQKRAAQEALLTAQREAARLKGEADAARKRAEELSRRANDSESQQSALMQEVLRKVEAAELMRLEAEEQAAKLREAADLSRKRAEDEARRAAEVEAARVKALEESERRARLTDEIRRKADEEIARLKAEADAARSQAEEARKKSVAAEAARRQIEEEIKQQPRVAAPAAKADVPPENELENIEQELARLQEKLESKKRAAVTRQQERAAATPPVTTANSGEPELLQNVYDIHQKTQKLPAFKQNTDVGKVRKSGWISDSILWETTIGLRDDVEAEKELGNLQPAETRAPEPPAPEKARIEPTMRALSSGELRMQEAKRSVFTSREASTTSTQRRADIPERSGNSVALVTAVVVAVVAVAGTYLVMNNADDTKQKISNVLEKASNLRPASAPTLDTKTISTPATTATVPKTGAKSAEDPSNSNGAIQRKESPVTDPAPKAKREVKTSAIKTESPAKPVTEAPPGDTPAATLEAAAPTETTATPTPVTNAAPAASSADINETDDTNADQEATRRPGAPLFTDKAEVN